MNNDETPNAPQTPTPEQVPPTPSPTPTPLQEQAPVPPFAPMPVTPTPTVEENKDGVWVPKAQYENFKVETEKQLANEKDRSKIIRTFYILLAITGLLLFVLYIGMLISPSEYISKGNCQGQEFLQIAFWLNPIAYIMLLATGIVGCTTKRMGILIASILFIVAAPIGWFLTGLGILGPLLCGV